MSPFTVILVFLLSGCGSEPTGQAFRDADAPTVSILEPKAKAAIKADPKAKPGTLRVMGEVSRGQDSWTPALVLVKVTDARNQRMELGSRAEPPRPSDSGNATFDIAMDPPRKKGKYRVIVVAMGEIPAPPEPGSSTLRTKPVKTEPVAVEIEVVEP